MFQLFYTKNARKDLKRLEREVAVRILRKLDYFMRQDDPLFYANRLTNFDLGEYRFRVGNYRVIFDVDDEGEIQVLMILSVKHRREAMGLYDQKRQERSQTSLGMIIGARAWLANVLLFGNNCFIWKNKIALRL